MAMKSAAKNKPRPTLGNVERRVMAAMIQAKVPGIDVDWKSGHGTFLTAGKGFCTITREGDLALKLSPERMEELLGAGEVKPRQFGERVMEEWVVIGPLADPPFALQLLREAKAYVQTTTSSARRKKD